jgi:aspartyl-tRNA(Asn)/glutamyl-tRNA(Gln) amidotransferase subunit C
MTDITEDNVAYIAHLARLAISPEEQRQYAEKLTELLGLIEQMNQVNTDDVQPLAHPLDTIQRLRPDRVTKPDRRAELRKNAPAVEKDLYLVPKVIEDA